MSLAALEIDAIIVVGIALWLALVFEALLGLRIIKLKGALHSRVHRIVALSIIGVGLVHGAAAVLGFVFNIWP